MRSNSKDRSMGNTLNKSDSSNNNIINNSGLKNV